MDTRTLGTRTLGTRTLGARVVGAWIVGALFLLSATTGCEPARPARAQSGGEQNPVLVRLCGTAPCRGPSATIAIYVDARGRERLYVLTGDPATCQGRVQVLYDPNGQELLRLDAHTLAPHLEQRTRARQSVLMRGLRQRGSITCRTHQPGVPMPSS